MGDCFLLIDYYYLDNMERERFANNKHDYIIDQLYYTSEIEITDSNRNIKFNRYFRRFSIEIFIYSLLLL